ncbi:hypothetical protein AMC90_CH04341 [Rhizobium phaseoli]|uniref:Uncharacterized protein n=2 Tax=Rhizobium TaxID=379 RepID=A0A192TGT8_9HYPH|nr:MULTISPECIES: hypothetical protein [Rhizobium]ACE93323.1 hypothetical protein RHECIAT_CH0004396 [Rhizobium etli CIAT 652]MDH6648724.1 hypothetical protein [Rhizobium esperanzae]ANL30087.1 hypothetical protein AMC90_CH04341 [Rhizobium phaseoli]ANL36329.1 hypothetical protein AMC89_CH04339 [Rhizobium phaseoli]ANL42713.1 hypothetical protein AMC88_CH04383 [Rhizobium phaseoli]
MMMAFDDIFDATLSTILHAGMEMCGGRKNENRSVYVGFGYEIGKISDNFPFPASKKHQNHPAGPYFRDFFEESSASLQKISP